MSSTLSPSQVIEIRQVQPAVQAWVLRSAFVFAIALNVTALLLVVSAVQVLTAKPQVWAVLPSGQTVQIQAIAHKWPQMQQQAPAGPSSPPTGRP
jgi:hypothetical protein